jgi:hypothetical protein
MNDVLGFYRLVIGTSRRVPLAVNQLLTSEVNGRPLHTHTWHFTERRI